MERSPVLRVPCLPLVAALLVSAGCGGSGALGGSPAGNHVSAPLVRGFSPVASPIDLDTQQQTPTFTDGMLTVSTDPSYPGKIVVFLQTDTQLDPATVFAGGRPEMGLNASALQITRYVPGTGNVNLALADVRVEADRIVCTPAGLPLPDGQYGVVVNAGLRNVEGRALQNAPVLHSFTVGDHDDVAPYVVTTKPANDEIGVGAGAPPPMPQDASQDVADIRTSIFGPASGDVRIRFNEGIAASTVSPGNFKVVDAGWPPAAGPPPPITPAPGFPKLKSVADGDTLPSNGHEVLWRPDALAGGFPFGTIVRITVVGLYDSEAAADADDGTSPDNPAPIADLAGNRMRISYTFRFQTVAPPDLPQNPFPEYAIYWATSDRIGALDSVNQQGLADLFTGVQTFPYGVPRNVIPEFTDTIATSRHIPGFDPTEISVDGRTNPATCHTWLYVTSPNSGEVVVVNSRTSIPVAILQTPSPGGISNQTGGGQAANVVVVTNASANTLTTFDVSNVTPGTNVLNGPIFVGNVMPTGNTPRAVTISLPTTGLWSRDPFSIGPPVPLILYADFTDGVVNTAALNGTGPIKQFTLGPNAAPNDIVMTPCFGQNPILFAAISQGSLPGQGKVSYYVAGPNCTTGFSTTQRPDDLVGDLTGFDGPAGLDEVYPVGNGAFFVLAESGAQANRVRTLGVEVGAANQPRVLNTFEGVGANPVAVAHRASWQQQPLISALGPPWLSTSPSCWYNGTQQYIYVPGCPPTGLYDCTLEPAQAIYICARGAGQISIVDLVTGARDFYSPVHVPGIRTVAGPPTQ